ncbi:hypothetical protein DM02DRAFT_590626 [Periconia macrospinosa]|uniref:NACHT domain-containing protein n=1 Tax=Periconia macrospinosa TaxID=97972 RepID=A0A2V1DV39_9PLEO|nr:hypothetical protein DM02DRAFT_590626 [Periconia macrospinosa]
MANPNEVDNPFEKAFQNVLRDFRTKLQDDELYRRLLRVKTPEEVYDLTDKLQEEQARTGRMRHLSKIQPFLEGLRSYANVIEVFMQAKPDVLALIWGPIKLILQWADALKQSMDAIIDTTEEIGARLPEFEKSRHMFGANKVIFEVLVLFFKDILDFYVVALNFFKSPRLKFIFEALWPRQKEKIKMIVENIGKHTLLLRNEVRLEHIQAEYDFRKKALEHFEKSEISHLRQEYRSLQTEISPPSYEETLAHIDDCTRPSAGMWLMKHDRFRDWADTTKQSNPILWLQGIPGSGKTHLARAVVHEVQSKGHSLFAFLSYKATNSISTMSLFHSLIFQLSADDSDLQSIVCNSSGAEFRRNPENVQSVFRTLLSSTGPVYVILDGLDEIDGSKRCRILQGMLQLSAEIDTLRVLISSRPEADLMSLMRDKCSEIRVDAFNVGGIQSYVSQRTSAWYKERQFSPEVRNEMETLLAPLVAKSKGMFLYAKVVLDSIDSLEPDDIMRDLQILPETLHDAYSRVLERINKTHSAIAKEKARMIIGWIAVSPTPLTIYELEQALAVHAQGITGTGRMPSSPPLVRLCGPIVEVVDEYVQYVHFTVYEYFLSPQISNSIDPDDSRISLTASCIKYLCQHHHESTIDQEARSSLILGGAYRFHHYASSFWLELVEKIMGRKKDLFPSALMDLLEILFEARGGSSPDLEAKNSSTRSLQFLETLNPKLHSEINSAISFRDLCSKSGFELRRNCNWTNLDPLDLSRTSCQIFEETEKLLIPLSNHDKNIKSTLERHYGQRLYKCAYVDCIFKRHGFDSSVLRREHEKGHEKPWKCSFADCEYHEGGFLSRKMRDDHLNSFHCQDNLRTHNEVSQISREDLGNVCLDLVRANDIAGVENILTGKNRGILSTAQAEQLVQCAGQFASLEMIILIKKHRDMLTDLKSLVQGVLEGNNLKLFQALLTLSTSEMEKLYFYKHSKTNYGRRLWLPQFMGSNDPEMLEMLCNWIEQDIQKSKEFAYPVSATMISATRGNNYKEQLLLELWRTFPKHVWYESRWKIALSNVASTTCSLKLAGFLIEQHIPIDFRSTTAAFTPLLHASKLDNAAAAEFMKFLLCKGAKTVVDVGQRSIRISEQKGAQNIFKWLGFTWDELVAEGEKAKGHSTDSTA